MAQPTQGSGGGWVANRPVGSPGRIPTTDQKWLRGKNGKSCHGKQYKKAIDMHSEKGENSKQKNRNIERKNRKQSIQREKERKNTRNKK